MYHFLPAKHPNENPPIIHIAAGIKIKPLPLNKGNVNIPGIINNDKNDNVLLSIFLIVYLFVLKLLRLLRI